MVAVGDVPLKDHGQGVMDLIASDAVLNEAYAWLCVRRKDYSPHDDVLPRRESFASLHILTRRASEGCEALPSLARRVRMSFFGARVIWTLRERWADVKPRLQRSLLRGEYRCDVTRRVPTADGVIEIWSAADALVLKATALVLQKELAPVLSPRCFHLAGHGGLKGAVRAVDAARRDQTFVFRTDVHGYYASLDHGILYRQVREHVTDRRVLKLVGSYLRRMVCEGGEYVSVTRGISLGCPLSPLVGALYLKPLDDLMERLDRPYVRYMDDWVILAKTRWALRRVVQQVNTILDDLKLEKHPDKTFIGRIDRGFDFLEYRFVAEGLRLAAQTKQRFVERATRLYEQGATASRIGDYVRHWLTWVRSGCLEHVWDELLVGVMRSSDVLVMVAGVRAGFRSVPGGVSDLVD